MLTPNESEAGRLTKALVRAVEAKGVMEPRATRDERVLQEREEERRIRVEILALTRAVDIYSRCEEREDDGARGDSSVEDSDKPRAFNNREELKARPGEYSGNSKATEEKEEEEEARNRENGSNRSKGQNGEVRNRLARRGCGGSTGKADWQARQSREESSGVQSEREEDRDHANQVERRMSAER